MTVLTWAVVSYAAGSFPSTWFVALATGKRVVLSQVRRDVGEADAHVLLRSAGGHGATVAATMDVLKALVPVVLAIRWAGPYEVAAAGVAAVGGHCWPPLLGRYAGRGLAAGAGAFLGFLPLEMVVAGIVRLLGSAVSAGGLASTVGYVAVPVIAALRGQPAPYVAAATAINVLIFVRRLEGIGEDLAYGLTPTRATLRRLVLDASARPREAKGSLRRA